MARDCIYRFGDFTLDTRSRMLGRDGTETRLREMSFNLLVYLLENAGRHVPNQTLMQGRWHDGHPLSSNEALNQHFSALYKLGISPRNGYLERDRRRDTTRFLKFPQISESGSLDRGTVTLPGTPTFVEPRVCPYRGLSAFRQEDSHVFFGRDAVIQRLTNELKKNRVVNLVGSSGSGKSSLICAGVLPALSEARPQAFCSPVLFTPGRTPYLNLALSLIRAWASPDQKLAEMLAEAHALTKMLTTGQIPLASCLTEALGKSNSYRNVLVIVDQLEELFSFVPSDEQAGFLQLLLASASDDPRVRILFAIRGDYYGDAIAADRAFADNVVTVPLGRMTRQELSESIVKPALVAGFTFENGLVDRLLDDAEAQPSALPLLSFTLSELWHLSQWNQLTHALYDSIGGVKEVVAKAAENVYLHAAPTQQKLAMRILSRLVHVGSKDNPVADTKQSINWDYVNDEERNSIDPFIQARLLVIGNSGRWTSQPLRIPSSLPTTVELAHESVWRHWNRLKEHIERNREFLSWLPRLRGQIATWDVADRHDSALLRGPLLAEASEWMLQRKSDLQPLEREFIECSARNAADEDIRITVAIGNRLFGLHRLMSWVETLACWSSTQAIELALSHCDDADAAKHLVELAERLGEIGCYKDRHELLNRILNINRDRPDKSVNFDSRTKRNLAQVLCEAGMLAEAKIVMRDIQDPGERLDAASIICDRGPQPDGETLVIADETTEWVRAADDLDYRKPQALGSLSVIYKRLGAADISAELASDAVSALDLRKRNPKNLFSDISATLTLAIAFAKGGIEQQAASLVARALQLIGTEGRLHSSSLTQAAEILWAIGESNHAKSAIEDALVAAEDDGDHSVWSFRDIAYVCTARGNLSLADRALNEVVRKSAHFSFGPRAELWGWVVSQRWKLQETAAMATLADELLQSANCPRERVFALCSVARSLLNEGPAGHARDLLLTAAKASEEIDNKWWRISCLGEVGHLLDTGGWKNDAVAPTLQASSDPQSVPAIPNGVMTLAAVSAGLHRLGELETANRIIEKALELADSTRPTHDSPVPYPQIAMVLASFGRYQGARQAADRSSKAWSQLMGFTAVLSESLSARRPDYSNFLPNLYIDWKRGPMIFTEIPSHRERLRYPYEPIKLIRSDR